MYENIERFGPDQQKLLYNKYGDMVIDEYLKYKGKNHPRQFIISKMQAKIITLDPSKVSNHIADINKLNVVDIAPSSIQPGSRPRFLEAIKSSSKVSKYIAPPLDPAYHLEIPQPNKS